MEIARFSITQILREINFGDFRSAKTAIFAIFGAVSFVNLAKYQPSKRAKISSKLKFRASENVKMAYFALLQSPKLISRKI